MTTGTMKLNGLKIGNDPKTAAANMRIELRAAFPGVKFSVRVDSYTAINVRWNDGPTVAAVDAIVQRYTIGMFDGMTDSYSYNRDEFNEMHGGVQYVFTRREYTADFVRAAAVALAEQYGLPVAMVDTLATKFNTGDLWRIGPNGDNPHHLDSWKHLMNVELQNASAV